MSTVEHKPPRTRESFFETTIKGMLDDLCRNPKLVEDRARMETLYKALSVVGPDKGSQAVVRRMLEENGRCRELLAVLKKLQTENLELGWVISRPFSRNGDGQRYVYAMGITRPDAPQLLRIVDFPKENQPEEATLFDPPFLCLYEATTRLFVGPAPGTTPPMAARIQSVVAAHCDTPHEALAELEIVEGPEDRTFTVFASRSVAEDAHTRLKKGESVSVRVECGLAVAVHNREEKLYGDNIEFISPNAPGLDSLVLPPWLLRECRRDIRHMVRGRPDQVRVIAIGPTGVGKTTVAKCMVPEALRMIREEGRDCAGGCVIFVSSQDCGSSLIHQTERNFRKTFRDARKLAEDKYLVIILMDEGDQMLGEMDGAEHSHNRTERLALQALLSEDTPAAVYVTANPRRHSWFGAPIERRFTKRVFPRPSRGLMERVALLYIREHPVALERLGVSDRELAGRLTDNLFADFRVVASCRLFSGREMLVRARDLHICSPGKVKQVIEAFCFDVEDGCCSDLEELWTMLDQEFQSPSLSAANFQELTFLAPPTTDSIQTVELAR